MFLRTPSITRKLALGFAALVAIVVLVAGLALHALKSEHGQFTTFVSETEYRLQLAGEVLDASNARAIAARNLVLVTAPQDMASEKAAVAEAHARVGDGLARLQKAVTTMPAVNDRERRLLADLVAIEKQYGPLALEIVNLALNGKRDDAVARMNRDCRPLLARLVTGVNAYASYGKELATHQVAEAGDAYAASQLAMLAAVVAAVLFSAVLGFVITKGITTPIRRAVTMAETVAAGDLRTRIEVSTTDEIGQLLRALGSMNDSLAKLVTGVRRGSDSIATGSAQIAASSLDLSRRTEEQAASLEQTAASMEQMTATVRNSADVARQASQLAASASSTAEQGGRMVHQVVATMGEISDSSRRIADIIGTIDGIAFQTNILALNAAVEAARAGEQGRGFAVVAGEVRNLAQRSAGAAREIKALIGASVERVEAGSHAVAQAGDTMQGIVDQVRQVADLITEISAATQQQTGGIGQVNDAVSLLDRTTQHNAALVEESSASAESLKQQAAELARTVSVFKLA